jgi:hypothetical protein
MLHVNVISRHLDRSILRQTPGQSGRWGECIFTINAREGRFDCIVGYDDFREPLTFECPREGLIFITGEPPGIKHYDTRFLAQFHRVLTPHSDIAHGGLVDSHCGMPWHVGVVHAGDGATKVNLTFDDLVAARPAKTKLLSVIAARRNVTPAHKQRHALVTALQSRFGDQVEVFGRDIRAVDDKWDAVAPYRYHVALENSRIANYWTEKLSDCFLADALPFYWGCPNLDRFFPEGSYQTINLYDPASAVRTIERLIESQAYERSATARAAARDAVLRRHNFFAVIDETCRAVPLGASATATLQPESTFRDPWTRKLRHRLRRAVPRALRPKRWEKWQTAAP